MAFRLTLTISISLGLLVGQVTCECGNNAAAKSNLFACFRPDSQGNCPFSYEKVPDASDGNGGQFSYCGYSNQVCCQISPTVNIKVKDTPCLDKPCEDKESRNKAKKIISKSILSALRSSAKRY